MSGLRSFSGLLQTILTLVACFELGGSSPATATESVRSQHVRQLPRSATGHVAFHQTPPVADGAVSEASNTRARSGWRWVAILGGSRQHQVVNTRFYTGICSSMCINYYSNTDVYDPEPNSQVMATTNCCGC